MIHLQLHYGIDINYMNKMIYVYFQIILFITYAKFSYGIVYNLQASIQIYWKGAKGIRVTIIVNGPKL